MLGGTYVGCPEHPLALRAELYCDAGPTSIHFSSQAGNFATPICACLISS